METIVELLNGSFLQNGALYLLRNVWGFPPFIQTIHILGICCVMASIVIIDLRILGLAVPSQNLSEMTRRLMPWLWWALASNLISGGVFVVTRPARYFNNPVFIWKFTFMIPAIALTLLFHLLSRTQENYWSLTRQRVYTSRAIALASLGLWIMVVMAGRWIAYSEYIYFPAE